MADNGLAELLAGRLAEDPSRPLVTFYDDATGERVELSGRTFANWVAKTANLLVDGLGAQPGDRAVLVLPPHWQTAVWLMACWSAGLVAEPVEPDRVGELVNGVVDGVEPDGGRGPYLLVAAEEVLSLPGWYDAHAADAEEVVGLSLHALGGPLGDHPAEILDYAVEVRGYGDRFVSYAPVDVTAPVLRVAEETPATNVTFATLTAGELTSRSAAAAHDWGLDARSRVLTDLPFTTLGGLLVGLVAPLAAGSSVIIQRNLDEAVLNRRISLEHVTAVAGVHGWDDASGSVRRLTT
ncbi:TIGR03089 family protein [Thermomonospora echinospora]|uniref:TIGR03089 family protein n=1 Tax=Thermomonospora echinospora TaxID=1992 RepID=A0A1H5WEK0_9ACTN|nr:TIGR03089 family protein [Thermomonospora echinospora]SEF97788.1 TIGR03089 family protein [Thermomonospora echinospora]